MTAGHVFEQIENLVIVGSGPAGYTAAIYAARANLHPLLITGYERGGIPGGQLMTTTHVENFPGFPDGVLGPDLMDLMKAQAIRWGTHLLEADADAIDLSERPYRIEVEGRSIRTHAVIIATGARANRLGVPSEDKFWSSGISACAICDGATPQFRNEELAVVGGGDSACEEAVYLTKYGSHVHLLVRSDRLRASAAMADRVTANPMITVHWNSEIVDVSGDSWLQTLTLRDRLTDQQTDLPVRGLFYYFEADFLRRLVDEEDADDGTLYDDQYITNAGQMALVALGTYRVFVDPRPAIAARLGVHTTTAKPYDVGGAFVVAEAAGAVVSDLEGAPLDFPMDCVTPIAFAAWACAAWACA